MNVFSSLTGNELFLVLSLILLLLNEFLKALQSTSWIDIYKPTLFAGIYLAYYAIFGPLLAIGGLEAKEGITGTVYHGLDHRNLLYWGWLGALVFYSSLLFGFYAFSQKLPLQNHIVTPVTERVYLIGKRLCLLGLLMFAVVTGNRILVLLNPLAATTASDSQSVIGGLIDVGGIVNYFTYAVNFLIPGVCLMFAAWLKQSRHTLPLLFWSLSTILIYISLGFRYRLVLLMLPLVLLVFLRLRRKPSLGFISLFLVAFLTLNGLIGMTRSYGQGLDLTKVEGESTFALISAGLGQEAGVFFTTAGVIEQTPRKIPFIGITPLIATILFPIPRSIFPTKPDASYISNSTIELYGGENYALGTAFLNYGEYYLMAGWPSLVGISCLIGLLLRRLWDWYLPRRDEPFAQVLYLISATFLYVVISRGYLPQVVMLFVFTVAPLFWIYRQMMLKSRP